MPNDLLSTKEVAKLLGVNEKIVYSLIAEKGLPATKVTGKWLFPLHLVEQWIEIQTINYPKLPVRGTTQRQFANPGGQQRHTAREIPVAFQQIVSRSSCRLCKCWKPGWIEKSTVWLVSHRFQPFDAGKRRRLQFWCCCAGILPKFLQ